MVRGGRGGERGRSVDKERGGDKERGVAGRGSDIWARQQSLAPTAPKET